MQNLAQRAYRKYRRVRDRLVLRRLARLPRFRPVTLDLMARPLVVPDAASFVHMYGEIFGREIYKFHSDRSDPYILDAGANIGLAVLYFRKLFPASRITAFEPDPNIFEVLRTNVQTFGHGDVTLVRRALWSSETVLPFASEGADAGRIARGDDAQRMFVRTVRLRDYLREPVDFLKLDIEGAETEVLEDCREELACVRNIFVEYHSFAGEKQTLARIVSILDAAGFRLHIHNGLVSPQPLVHREVSLGMDHRLNIFGTRP